MIPVVTTAQMRAIDEQAIVGDAVTGFSYMLKAGKGAYEAVKRLAPSCDTAEIAVLCGKGNNGGDGYVVGRLLLDDGYKVMCYGLCPGDALKGEAKRAFNEYTEREGNYFEIDDAADLGGVSRATVVVDAILGTGISGNPHGLAAEAIRMIRETGAAVVAVDTPSGLDNDTGLPGEPTVSATLTVTMGLPKIGQLFYPGRSHIGSLEIEELGYPKEIIARNHSDIYLPTRRVLAELLPSRRPTGSKLEHGYALLVCGSKGMTGSAALAASAAQRTGCGMVHLASPQSCLPVLATKLTEPVMHELSETIDGSPSAAALDSLLALCPTMQALLIGPGVSHTPETCDLVRELVSHADVPTVLDADGINAYVDRATELAKHASDLVITPHAREWERLFGPLPAEPMSLVQSLRARACDLGITVVHKGNPTIVVAPDGKAVILPVGNSGLATAGSGDVLSGILTSLIAQGCRPRDAAVLGVAVHGLAGEAASLDLGEHAMIAGDIIGYIHTVLTSLAPPPARGLLPSD